MKKMKRILEAGLVLLALAGCGTSDNQAAEYPAMEPLDISKMELATVENGTAKYQYDADVWTTEGEGVICKGYRWDREAGCHQRTDCRGEKESP